MKKWSELTFDEKFERVVYLILFVTIIGCVPLVYWITHLPPIPPETNSSVEFVTISNVNVSNISHREILAIIVQDNNSDIILSVDKNYSSIYVNCSYEHVRCVN